ncbi:MAG: hypothetical protein A2W61_00095 [Deltaproteobacteria bacterium RIFCSPLOWO2_01_44_7]|nr:MAG: hypothetical protein A2712_00865 [Deltaproteobacteria bacterium RIFCSPHIGHO2_01_FULL_43_49]OGQ15307.1 MAG: hypothetical protein A3D22_04610 [Deltaproteobacteria bacterium RIFCSPHIGHO2_02_FULL_44_53]OGQ27069.1 MAG: hypothetical protein A3D98_01455 [Deltaproteobacteria bacterium RIFCSPHIGHO2_12_FULL_44_21]OGQ31823.1 MAG: hypothetical protein A2979_05770 [Deltaproteobacteria bacterium RIFCSPLOWO2_01_FULL_45_74]OGQ37637.1 MAG: hypothetical protein A2W61_00095 [Deltaproteobacteria bacterium 
MRTDFGDPAKPVRRYIGPDGQFNDQKSDGVVTQEECYQAAIELAELTARQTTPEDLLKPNLFLSLKEEGLRIPWLPTDPFFFETPVDNHTLMLAEFYFDKAQKIWDSTKNIANPNEQKKVFAKNLFEKMSLSKEKGGFGIRFFNPESEKISKTDHPFYSDKLDCFGNWLYGILCEQFGIKATPIQRFTDADGTIIHHVLVGLYLDSNKITLVSFQPHEAGFDISIPAKDWIPISRLELLAYLHLTRAFELYPQDRNGQLTELKLARRYAPHNYVVNYQIGYWYYFWGRSELGKGFLRKSLEFNSAYTPASKLLAKLEQ